MNDTSTHYGSEIAIGILGFLAVGLFVAMIVLLVAKPVKYADAYYPSDANTMAIENYADYGSMPDGPIILEQIQINE